MPISSRALFLASIFALFSFVDSAHADKVCIKGALKKGQVSLTRKIFSGAKCGRGYTEVGDTSGAQIYGDGSGGAFPGTSGFDALFSSVSITASQYPSGLTTPSGVTIRSTGDCEISGRIIVNYAANSGIVDSTNFSAIYAGAGISHGPAGNGKLAVGNELLYGGNGGIGVHPFADHANFYSAPLTGGGGGGGSRENVENGRSGGGGFRLFCRGAIHITSTGSIEAVGRDGADLYSGGGGGGVVVLISKSSIVNEGSIKVNGGNGNAGGAQYAAGGGGGGGLVALIAPKVTAGTVNLSGGAAGALQSIVTPSALHTSGGGGGGSIGSGGSGAGVSDDGSGTTSAGAAGEDGALDTIITTSPETYQ